MKKLTRKKLKIEKFQWKNFNKIFSINNIFFSINEKIPLNNKKIEKAKFFFSVVKKSSLISFI